MLKQQELERQREQMKFKVPKFEAAFFLYQPNCAALFNVTVILRGEIEDRSECRLETVLSSNIVGFCSRKSCES